MLLLAQAQDINLMVYKMFDDYLTFVPEVNKQLKDFQN